MKREQYDKEITELYHMAVKQGDTALAYQILSEHASEIDVDSVKVKE